MPSSHHSSNLVERSEMNYRKFHDGHMTFGVQKAPRIDYFAKC